MASSEAVPIRSLPDGREFIAAIDIRERPEIEDFVRRFPNYWKPHPLLDGVVGPYPYERETLLAAEHGVKVP